MRTAYETLETLQAERSFMHRYEAAFSVHCEKLPVSYRLDYAVMEMGQVVQWLELKNRSHAMHKYPAYWISLGKFLHGAALADRTTISFILAVRFSDCDALVNCSALSRKQWGIAHGGRRDRNDPADMEPLVTIPINLFERF